MKISSLVTLGRIAAFAIIVLGIIHDVATFTPLIKGGLSCLSAPQINAMVYMSLICGTSFILSGIILLLLLKDIEKHVFLSTIVLVCGVFLAVSGILAIAYMPHNPFALATLLLGICIFLISMSLKMRLRNK